MLLWRMILDSFFKKKLIDEFFGEIEFQRISFPEGLSVKFWNGKKYFTPLNKEISFTLNISRKGPKPYHRVLYKEIEVRYFDLLEKIKQLTVSEEYKEYFEENFYLYSDIINDFDLVEIDIDDKKGEVSSWSFNYVKKTDNSMELTIGFENFVISNFY
jgi:hypothetical protein